MSVDLMEPSPERPPVPMPWKRPGDDRWTVQSDQVGTGFSVHPGKGLMGVENWALNPYHRKGLGNFCAQVWRMFSGVYYRREYPKTAEALAKALAECEVWCEMENVLEEHACTMYQAVAGKPE